MATGTIQVPHKPEFHDFSLPAGLTAQPVGANNGYYLFPDGKVRIEVNLTGATPNTFTTVVSDFPYPPTKAASVSSSTYGTDANVSGAQRGMTLQALNDGIVRVWSTSTFARGYIEYYP